jgi:hypothetical protein
MTNPGVIDENVNTMVRFDRVPNSLRTRLGVCNIKRTQFACAAVALYQAQCFLRPLLVSEEVDQYMTPSRRQGRRHRPANAATRPCDQGYFFVHSCDVITAAR